MRIIYKDEIYYEDVDIGTIFEDEDAVFIKTNILEEDTQYDYVAVNLETGGQCPFGSRVKVKPLNAELHIV